MRFGPLQTALVALTTLLIGAAPAMAADSKDAALSMLPVRGVTLKTSTNNSVLSVQYTQLFERFSIDASLEAPFNTSSGLAILARNSTLSSGLGLGAGFYYDTRIDPLSDEQRLAIMNKGVAQSRAVLKAACAIRYGRTAAADEQPPACTLSNVVAGRDYPQTLRELKPELVKWCSANDWRLSWIEEGLADVSAVQAQLDPAARARWAQAIDKATAELSAAKTQKVRYTQAMLKPKRALVKQAQALLAALTAVDQAQQAVAAAQRDRETKQSGWQLARAALDVKRMAVELGRQRYLTSVAELAGGVPQGRAQQKQTTSLRDRVAESWTALQLSLVDLQLATIALDDARDQLSAAREQVAATAVQQEQAKRVRDEIDAGLSRLGAHRGIVSCDTIAQTLGQLAYVAWHASRVSQLEGIPFGPDKACQNKPIAERGDCPMALDVRVGVELSGKFNRREAFRSQDDILVDVVDDNGRPIQQIGPDGNPYLVQQRGDAETFSELAFEVGASAQLFVAQRAALSLRAGLDAERVIATRQVELCSIEQVADPAFGVRQCGNVDVLTADPAWRYSGYVRAAATVLFSRPAQRPNRDALVLAPGGELRVAGEKIGHDPHVDVTAIVFAAPGDDFMRGRLGIGTTLSMPTAQPGDAELIGFGFLGSVF